ncbi:MAG: GAF domain-containing protein [Chloroflexi bacterium]|nr:GAF domain-containing protein [Chloroflexota bacterium]
MNAYTEADQRLLETLAAQIAIAIQNARLFEAERLRRQEAETLRQAANTLASSLDLENVLNSLLNGLALVLSFDSAVVFLNENENYRAIATRGFDPPELVKGQVLSGSNTLAKDILETRRPIILPDVKADDRFENWGPTDPIRGWMGVPLIVRDQAIGFLTIDSHHPNAFTDANAEMALAFANHAAAAIQNATLYEDAVRRMAELEALYESGLALSKSLDPREISERVVSVLANRLNWHHAALRVRRGDSDEVELLAFSQTDSQGRKERIDTGTLMPGKAISKVGQGMAGWVIKHGRMINNGDQQADPRYDATFPNMNSGLYVPIQAGGQTLGCISVESGQPAAFSEADERLLTTLASQAASALENARLYQEALLAAERRSVLHQVSQEVARISQDSEQLYGAIYQAAARLMPTDMFTIALVNEAENQIDGAYAIDRGKRGPFISFQLNAGIAGRVIETNKTLLIEDYDDPSVTIERVQFADNPPTRSILAVPLRSGEKAIGSMSVQSYQPGKYTEEDGVLLEMLGAQAAAAIENTRLFEQVRRRIKEQEALNRASQALTGSLDLEPLLESILSSAKDAIAGAEKGTILLWDKDSNNLRVHTQIGYTDTRILELPFRSEKGYSGRAFREKRPILIENAIAEYEPPFDESIEEVNTVQSGIVVPLFVKDTAIGVIALDNATKEGAFTEEDLNLLMIFASSAAGVIENARLFEETRRRAEEFSSLYETARDISNKQDLHLILQTLVERSAEMLNAPDGGLYLYDAEQNDLVLAVELKSEASAGVRLRLGEGAAGLAASTREPVIIDDYRTWEGRSPLYKEIPFRAVLEVPMLYSGELIGILVVDELGESERKFTEADVRLLSLFASHAASAVHNARLLAETRRRVGEFEALYQTAAEVSSETDLKVLLNTIIRRAQTLSSASGSGLYLFDSERSELELVAINDPDIRIGTRLALGEGLAGRVAQNKQPLIVNNYQSWDNSSSHYKGLPITSVLGIPMLYSGELIGVLNVHNRADPNQTEPAHIFTEQDINLLSLFANTAAGAVYSARLLDKTLHRLDELAALAQVSSALRTASTRAEMMAVLLDQVMDVLHADGGNVVSSIIGHDDLLVEAAHGVDARYAGMWIPPGEGLSRRVLDSGEPYILADARIDPSFFNPDRDGKAYAIALVPLKYQDKTIGVISMGRTEKDGIMPAPFSDDDVRLLNAIADMAANAFQRASLHEETTRYAERLVIINDLGHTLSETLDLPHIYENLSRAALDLLPDSATIFVSLFDSSERSIKAAYGVHAGTVLDAANLPTKPFDESGNENQNQVILSGEPLIVPDLSVSLKDKTTVRIKSESEEQVTQSALYVPMKAEGRVIGVLHVQSYTLNRYTSADAELLELIANTAAVAIQNARLFTQLQRRVDQLSALHSVDTAIGSTTDLRVSLQSVLENITRQLKVDAADV